MYPGHVALSVSSWYSCDCDTVITCPDSGAERQWCTLVLTNVLNFNTFSGFVMVKIDKRKSPEEKLILPSLHKTQHNHKVNPVPHSNCGSPKAVPCTLSPSFYSSGSALSPSFYSNGPAVWL